MHEHMYVSMWTLSVMGPGTLLHVQSIGAGFESHMMVSKQPARVCAPVICMCMFLHTFAYVALHAPSVSFPGCGCIGLCAHVCTCLRVHLLL